MKKVGLAVIGYGGMGGWHTEHLLKSDVCELAGVYDIKPERNALAESRGIYAYPTYEALLADKSVELITVAIPNDDHEGVVVAALNAGKHVVTSNKAVVAAYGRELTKLAYEKNVRFLYEASVGGGIPIIRPMNICLSANDIYEIQGILNGTTNYILTKMTDLGLDYNDVLKDAQEKGFAEADPTADVEGIDAAMQLGANHPMGPLALGDLVGLDVCLAIMETLYNEYGDPKYRPHVLLRKMVRAGKLGMKSGEGFFDYSK